METFYNLAERFIWSGIAAAGFGILFNVPSRSLFSAGLLGAFAGLIKFPMIMSGVNIILASLAAATFVGFISVPLAHRVHTPPFVFSIPAIIPMIPGYFAYKMILGLFNLTVASSLSENADLMFSVFNNGLKMIFILFSISIGVSLPMLISRRQTVKNLSIKKLKKIIQ
ncbi:MAG: threonine/serine exporter [Ignavibacteria bacterium]|nr:threonine/serine exporter [Ignavibacteria bacterium]